jgi:acetyl esterase
MAEPITRSSGLHPEVRALLEMMDAQGGPRLETQDPVEARIARVEGMILMGGPPAPLERVEDLSIPGPAGSVPARLYATGHGGLRPALIYFHGGGFVFGNLDTHDSLCRALAKASDAIVISVDYRLAPEHKFPAAVDDSYAATQWVAANAERLGIDACRVSVGGDSAGGNLATVIAMRCRATGGPKLSSQVLLYPVTDMGRFDTASYVELAENYFLTRAAMEWFGGHYVAAEDHKRHPEVSPLRAPDLSGLPPALVITAEFDPLRDEGEAYARRLEQAGVQVTSKCYPGMIHGFVSMHAALSGGREAIQETAKFLAQSKTAEV